MHDAHGLPITRAGRGTERMQHEAALGAASIAVSILLFLLLVGLLYDLIMGYSARRRFARLRALRNFWERRGRAADVLRSDSPPALRNRLPRSSNSSEHSTHLDSRPFPTPRR